MSPLFTRYPPEKEENTKKNIQSLMLYTAILICPNMNCVLISYCGMNQGGEGLFRNSYWIYDSRKKWKKEVRFHISVFAYILKAIFTQGVIFVTCLSQRSNILKTSHVIIERWHYDWINVFLLFQCIAFLYIGRPPPIIRANFKNMNINKTQHETLGVFHLGCHAIM